MYVCMKIARTYTLDIELAEKLSKEDNASEIVNKLVRMHYNAMEPMTLEQKKKKLAILRLQKAHEDQIEKLKQEMKASG